MANDLVVVPDVEREAKLQTIRTEGILTAISRIAADAQHSETIIAALEKALRASRASEAATLRRAEVAEQQRDAALKELAAVPAPKKPAARKKGKA